MFYCTNFTHDNTTRFYCPPVVKMMPVSSCLESSNNCWMKTLLLTIMIKQFWSEHNKRHTGRYLEVRKNNMHGWFLMVQICREHKTTAIKHCLCTHTCCAGWLQSPRCPLVPETEPGCLSHTPRLCRDNQSLAGTPPEQQHNTDLWWDRSIHLDTLYG